MSFDRLNIIKEILDAIELKGYETPTDIQVAAIPAILAGKDVMAGAQTGTGKTASFAIPIIQSLLSLPSSKAPRALVLAPTRELAKQVANNFVEYAHFTNLKIGLVYGGVSIAEQVKRFAQGVDIVIATPGRLLDHLYKGSISLEEVRFLVFDEADRMLDMGFIDEINKIIQYLPEKRQTMLFSATFDDALFSLTEQLLQEPELIEVSQRNVAAATINQQVYNVDAHRKAELTSYLIGANNWHQVLIFTRTKVDADALAKEMGKDGIKAVSIHGDKSQGARERALSDFKEGTIRALVATDVAARGLDIKDLNYVINYELPYIAEDYVHRIGRTGRAGKEGLAISLLSAGEEWLLEEVEAIIDQRLPQQWLPGYEPDLTQPPTSQRKNSKTAQKRRTKQRAFGKKTGRSRKKPSGSR